MRSVRLLLCLLGVAVATLPTAAAAAPPPPPPGPAALGRLKADDDAAAAFTFAPPTISSVSPATFAVEGGDSVLVVGEALTRVGTGAVCLCLDLGLVYVKHGPMKATF